MAVSELAGALRIEPGWPHIFGRASCAPRPRMRIGFQKAFQKAKRHQRMSTIAKATNAIIIEFTDQRFCITPP